MNVIKEKYKEKAIGKLRSFYNFLSDKKYVLSFIVLTGILIAVVGSSLAALTPVSSITVPSTVLSYSDKEEGSWQYTKSAFWLSKDKAQINIKVDTLKKNNADYTDIVLMLDMADLNRSDVTHLRNELASFIDENTSKGNRISIITFENDAAIVSDFTDDTAALMEIVNDLSSNSNVGSSYYQALIKLDELLSTYSKESNRNCVAVLFADGEPTLDIPSEVGEYRYLKSKYDYLNINGVQYKSGEVALPGIKNSTDAQFFAIKTTIYDALIKASLTTDLYEKFVLTDYVDDNYFNLDNITDITTTFGEATISNNKVLWDLSGLRSGLDASLTININLNNDLKDVGGVYSTHSQTDVNYKIDKTSTTETTTKSTVLKDSYKVVYEGNAPSDCVVSNIPSSKDYSVFDTVQKETAVPVCTGYQFKGWKIITDDVKKNNDSSFIMPEEDVVIKATWSKLGLNKLSDGTVSESISLYKVLENEAKSGGLAKEYTGNHQDSMAGVGTEKIYHYYASTDDEGNEVQNKNNVIFAGFCWQMLRTTDTGGVKMIYNGEPDNNGKCGADRTSRDIGTSRYFDEEPNSLAYVGYMYNASYAFGNKNVSKDTTSYKYASSVTYRNGRYTLSGTSQTWSDSQSYKSLVDTHYTCFNTTGYCTSVYYILDYHYSGSSDSALTGNMLSYVLLSNGVTVSDALNEMLYSDNVNETSSAIKDTVEYWYVYNLRDTDYADYLEDVIFCNDRSTNSIGAWDSNGGGLSYYTGNFYLSFSGLDVNLSRTEFDLSCTNVTDKFSVSNPKAELSFPIGLATAPEMELLGNSNAMKSGNQYYLMSPSNSSADVIWFWGVGSQGGLSRYLSNKVSFAVRPVVSLKPGLRYSSGNGSTDSPYIVDLDTN